MFNEYVWNLYLEAGGREVAEKFENYLTKDFSESYADFIDKLHAVYCPLEEWLTDEIKGVCADCYNGLGILEDGSYTIKKALDAVYKLIKSWGASSDQSVFDIFSSEIGYFTTHLALAIPELFVPYYYLYNFNVLTNIADEFGIDIPPIPQKKDYKGRFYYYGEVCVALINFREEHNLSPYELCAFLYDFAPRYIGGIDSYIIEDLPEPRSAFFIGGAAGDKDISHDQNMISCWQCSPDIRAGDMVVMYLRTPVSAVDSVWRSVSVGFNDPFFYYYRCTYIAKPVPLKQISQKQLKEDAIFKDMPIVRKNIQGINGVELKPSEYNHLLDLGDADKSIKRLAFKAPSGRQKLSNEKDVEKKLIKPLLEKLGYSENDYVQQLYIEVGNHNHLLIPDFVLLPDRKIGHQSAFAVVEAKHSVANKKDLQAAKIQARSYAVQLKARYSAVMSEEGIWVYSDTDDFTEEVYTAAWNELKKADAFSALFKIIGKK